MRSVTSVLHVVCDVIVISAPGDLESAGEGTSVAG